MNKLFFHTVPVLCMTVCMTVLPADRAGATDSSGLLPGIYEISCTTDDTYVLDLKNCSRSALTDHSLQLYRPLQVKQQEFYLEKTESSKWRISSLLNGQAVTAQEASGCIRMQNPEPDQELTQGWILDDAGEDCFYIHTSTGKYLTLASTYAFNGASTELQGYTGSKNQRWKLNAVPVYPEHEADTDLVRPYAPDGPFGKLEIILNTAGQREVLTAAKIDSWYTETSEHALFYDETQLPAYVAELAQKYNTISKPLSFTTSLGAQISVAEGFFGWEMDETSTLQEITQAMDAHTRKIVHPVWTRMDGESIDGEKRIGPDYVEVDLTRQKVWLYKDGELLLETDCVSGTYGTDRQTPPGVYTIYYMQSPAVLRGADYESPVDYWMAFNGGIGLHDANWRDTFGGEIFRSSGSHGCINMPIPAAGKIYETVGIGYPVVCYY